MFDIAQLSPGTPSAALRGVPVAGVRCRAFRAPATDAVAMSFAPLSHRVMVLVELAFSDDTVALGESWINFPGWGWRERVATINEGIAPLLVGRSFTSTAEAHHLLHRALGPIGRQWGAPGPICQAISGVDAALWTRAAEEAGLPLARLVRGDGSTPVRELPAYASSLGPTGVAETAERCAELGFTAVKVKVGFSPDTDEATLRTTRQVLGDDVRVFADANRAWDPDAARSHAPLLREYGVEWLEEPLASDDPDELGSLAEHSGLPIATGENLYRAAAFEAYLRTPGVAIVQPDLGKVGGVTDYWQVVTEAAEHDTLVAPHLYNGAVSTATTLQVAAANPSTPWVEWDVRSNPLREPVSHLLTDHGTVTIPDRPGLGVDIDLSRLSTFEEIL
ncbi:MAG: mandelate racemase/muconate lactonizing enzyme family protein [Propionibacteriaceae bacterium]